MTVRRRKRKPRLEAKVLSEWEKLYSLQSKQNLGPKAKKRFARLDRIMSKLESRQ